MKLNELWKDLVGKLAEKLHNQILVFGVLIVIVVGLLGAYLAQGWSVFVYIVVIGVILVYLIERILSAWVKVRTTPPVALPNGGTPGGEIKPEAPVQPPPPVPGPKPTEPVVIALEELRNAYLQNIVEDCRLARLAALDPQAADPARGAFSLDKLYVSLNTRTQVRVEEDRGKKRASRPEQVVEEKSRPLPALEALWTADRQRMVLIGLPGSGKSTFVRYIALRHAQALKDPTMDLRAALEGWDGAALIPVIVPLGRMAEGLPKGIQRGRAEHVLEYIRQTLKADERAAPYAEHLFADLERRGGLFLFDGLDEVADLDRRQSVVQAVEDFAQRFGDNPRSRFLVTCRTFSYTDPRWQLAGWTTHELAPLTREKIEQFITAWHTELIRVDPARRADYETKQKKLRQALRPGDRRRLAEIADNPLILTVMAVVHTNKGELPDARALVYEECIDLLLLRWDAERPIVGGKSQKRNILDELGVPEIQLKNALQEIAYSAHASQVERPVEAKAEAALVTEGLLTGVLFPFLHDPRKVEAFLDYCEGANGLLLKQGVAPLRGAPPDSPPQAIYTFPHLTFQEYLAARYLRRKPNLSREVRQHLDRSDRWREAIMLLGEHLCFREGDQVLMDTILEALAPEPLPENVEPQDWRALWMAGDLLILYRRALGRYAHESRVLDGLVQLLQRSPLPARERAAAGDALAELGDPRFNKDLWYLPDEPLLGFVRIPAGPFKMGSDKKLDRDAYDNELPQHSVDLPEYYLSRYPTTVAQFRAFIQERGQPPKNPDSLRDPDNRPVRYVTWYEAVAYCRWLGKKLRALAEAKLKEGLPPEQGAFWRRLRDGELVVGLPSETEWEKAARGVDGQAYPWGDAFDPDKANTRETGLGTTSAVGCFPGGASPYGLLDLSGNVWEWTRSLWGEDFSNPDFSYPYNASDGRENLDAPAGVFRVHRGGAFVNEAVAARCAYRHWNAPLAHWFGGGFRVGAFGAYPGF